MNTPKALLGVLTFLCGLLSDGHSQPSLTNGLVAYYPFNGNANDATGSGLNGTVNNAVLVADRFSIPNSAYHFNSNNTSITFAWQPLPQNQVDNWTISAWVNPASRNQLSTAVMVGHDDGQHGDGFGLCIAGGFGIPGNNLFGVYGSVAWVDSDYTFPTSNIWFHTVMVRESGMLKFYLNGVQTPGTIGSTPNAPTAFTIGSASGTRYFNGGIDDVRIYSRALSSSEVQLLYQFESSPQPPPCVRRATATATVVNGFVVGVSMTDNGCGYTNTPVVLIEGGSGNGAAAVASVTNGMVINITVTDAGSGYTGTPTVYIYSPWGPQIGLLKSVKPTFTDLFLGTNYQLQSSTDLSTWTNQGTPFTATNPVMSYPLYFDVDNWNQLFFRLQVAP